MDTIKVRIGNIIKLEEEVKEAQRCLAMERQELIEELALKGQFGLLLPNMPQIKRYYR